MSATNTKLSHVAATVLVTDENDPTNAAHGVQLQFAHGAALLCVLGDFPPAILTQLMLHGLKQKLVDAAAIPRDTATGRSATSQDKEEAIRAVYERLRVGEWNKARDGESAQGSMLAQALVRLSGKSLTEIQAYLEGKSKEQLAALRATQKVAGMLDVIRAEKAAKAGIDGDAELAGLLGDSDE